MPENTNTNKVALETFPDATAHNTEVAQKLAAQDISGQNMAPVDSGDAADALDALAKSAEESAKKAAEAPTEEKPAENTPPAKTEAEIAEAKAAADKIEADRKRAEALFKDSPTLAPNASPKSAESFAAIKIKAAQEVAKLEAELEKLRKENAEAAERLKNTAPPEALKELEDHRTWRAKLDIESDPKWKTFDKDVETTREFIYAQLQRSKVTTPEIIAEIKKHGGPENVKMDALFAAIADPALQRTVESKIADIEQRKFEKSRAIEAAKTNVTEYVAERTKAAEAAAVQHNTATQKHLGELTKSLSWFTEKPIDPKAPEADRKSAAEHNEFVKTTKGHLEAAMKDDSPEMRAIMLTATAQLFYLQKEHAALKSGSEVDKKTIADLTAKLDKFKQGSVTRIRESNAPTNAPAPVSKKDDFNQSAGDALDNLRKQVTEERERAAANK
jgi:hypothetical protein